MEHEHHPLVGRRVTTPKGNGNIVATRMRDSRIEYQVKLDSYAAKGSEYDGTWFAPGDISSSPLTPPTLTFGITLRELTQLAFIAGLLFGEDNVRFAESATQVSNIVARLLNGDA